MLSVPRRSQRTLLLLSVVAFVQVYSVLAKSTVLGDKPIYVSGHNAFWFRIEAEQLCHLILRNRILDGAHVGDRGSAMFDGAEPF